MGTHAANPLPHCGADRGNGQEAQGDMRNRFVTAIAAWWLLAAGCGGATDPRLEPRGETITFTTVGNGLQSGIREPMHLAVTTQPAWDALWERHTGGIEPRPNLPPVDFSKEMVLAVFRGKTNGALPIEIRKVVRRGNELDVLFTEVLPPPGVPLGVGIAAYPFHIIRCKRSPGEVRFERVPPTCAKESCDEGS